MTRRGRSLGALALRRLARHRSARIGAVLVGLLTVGALLAPWVAPYGYAEQFIRRAPGVTFEAHAAPSGTHWLGLDPRDRDNLSRILYGGRVSLSIALTATVISVAIGIVVGATAGYLGGWTDEVFMRITDVVYDFPSILLAGAIAACFEERSMLVVALALGLVGWTGLARLVRAQTLVIREEDFVTAARALGASRRRILAWHVLPNGLTPVIISASLMMAGNILGEAGLGFLGISAVEQPYPSWGVMLRDARGHIQEGWWMTVFPGLAIALTTFGFNLFGDGLRDALDPKWVETPAA